MPWVEEVLKGVGKAEYISKLDLSKGYYQIPMGEKDVEKTAFTCHRGQYEFLRMPIGVKNAPAVFQELMQSLLEEEAKFSTPYMDDIVVYSDSWEEHLEHIDRVLIRLGEAGLTDNPNKCKWGGRNIEFLGHQIGNGKMSLLSHRAEALKQYTKPTTKKGLRAFLGAVGFYRRYVQRLAEQTAVLTPHTSKAAPSRVVWSREGELAFNLICTAISDTCSLCIPLPQDMFFLITDTSGLGVGGVLQVCQEIEVLKYSYFPNVVNPGTVVIILFISSSLWRDSRHVERRMTQKE